jgi:hypothetical protein
MVRCQNPNEFRELLATWRGEMQFLEGAMHPEGEEAQLR